VSVVTCGCITGISTDALSFGGATADQAGYYKTAEKFGSGIAFS